MQIRDWINKGVGWGLLISLLLCASGAALGAFLMSHEWLPMESAGKWMSFIWLPASFAGCKAALGNRQQARPARGAIQAALLNLLVWAAALAVSPVPNFGGNGWYITGSIWAGAALSAWISGGKRKRPKRRTAPRKGRAHKGHR